MGEAVMSKSDEGPQSLSHKVMEVVHSACQKTRLVFSELRAAEGAQPVTKALSPYFQEQLDH